jgi:hypothetical protein
MNGCPHCKALRAGAEATVAELEQLANKASDDAAEADANFAKVAKRDDLRGRATAYRDAARRFLALLRGGR